ncbi:hypothetical protein, partial [Planotetraspora kaengkrachanensis]
MNTQTMAVAGIAIEQVAGAQKPRRGIAKRVVGRAVMAVVAAAMTAMGVAVVPAGAVVPGGNGKIAFTSVRDGNDEIYVMNADGSGQTNLTN